MPVQQRGEETRNRILDVAQDAFARYGYDATGVAEICRRAGVTKGGFYHHFPSKQDVFLEMLHRWLEGLDRQLEAVRSGDETVPQELQAMTAMVPVVFQDAGGRLSLFLEFLINAGRSPAVWQATVAPFRKYHTFFSEMIADGVGEGSLRDVEPELASHLLLAFAVGLLAIGLLDPYGADWGRVAQEGIGILLTGMGAERPG